MTRLAIPRGWRSSAAPTIDARAARSNATAAESRARAAARRRVAPVDNPSRRPPRSFRPSPPSPPTAEAEPCGPRFELWNSTFVACVTRPCVSPSLIDEHRPFVRASLRHLGVHSCGLDDAEQDVFLVLVRRRGDFDPKRGLSERGWIWGICRNVAFAHQRRSRRASQHRGVAEPTSRPPIEDRVAALRALDSLDADSRALWLARCEGRSAAELARTLDLPLTTVQWRLRRAKHHMVSLLRGAARHGNAVLGWFIRPQRGLASLAAPLLMVTVLGGSKSESPKPPATAMKPQAVVPSTLRRRLRHPPPPTTQTAGRPPIEGQVTEEAPRVRPSRPAKRRPTAIVFLGEPSLDR